MNSIKAQKVVSHSREDYKDTQRRAASEGNGSPVFHEQSGTTLFTANCYWEERYTLETKNREQDRQESKIAGPHRGQKFSGKLGWPLRTSLSAEVGRFNQDPGELRMQLQRQFPSEEANLGGPTPHSPNVRVFLATDYTQVLFNHQVIVSWRFRSSCRFKL